MAVSTNLGLYLPTREDYISVKRDLSDNYEVIDEHAGMMENGSAIVINGDTAPKAITSGQYLLIKNHSTLASGSYHATTNIANGATIDNSNVAIDTNGLANALNSKIANMEPINGEYNGVALYLGGANPAPVYFLPTEWIANYNITATSQINVAGIGAFDVTAVNKWGKNVIYLSNNGTNQSSWLNHAITVSLAFTKI